MILNDHDKNGKNSRYFIIGDRLSFANNDVKMFSGTRTSIEEGYDINE